MFCPVWESDAGRGKKPHSPAFSSFGSLSHAPTTLKHHHKGGLYVFASQCTCFGKERSQLISQLLTFACIYYLLMILLEVQLIAHYHDDHVRGSVLPDSLHPALYILKCLVLCDIVDHKCALSFPIVTYF